MPDFIIEYLLTQARTARLHADTLEQAKAEIKHYHDQNESFMEDELVIILKVEVDEEAKVDKD